MENSTAYCVFVVDDDPAARSSLAALISSRGMPVESFGSSEDFLAAYRPQRRGCLVADVRMAGMSGLCLLERMNAEGWRLPVILITGFADVPMAVRAMHSGAFTFLEKPCGDKELLDTIGSALSTDQQREQQRAEQSAIQARRAALTPAEQEVLDRLLAGKPNKSIASELGLGLRTVELRRATIMKKMEAGSLAELVRLVMVAEGRTNGSGGAAAAR